MKIQLPDVTLASVSSIKISETIQALEKCCSDIDFGAVKIFTHEIPDNLPDYMMLEHCPHISNIMDYNTFIFYGLVERIPTFHCLLIQYDSWIIHPELWDNEWLQYDYIGAPWAYKENAYICHDTGEHVRVGNGGFSLRSIKVINAPWVYRLPLLEEQGWYNEDGNLCVYHRKKMLEIGIKYAPVEMAAKFSYENPVPENYGIKPFGFHKNMPPKTWEGV
jgi:hypothetical protein